MPVVVVITWEAPVALHGYKTRPCLDFVRCMSQPWKHVPTIGAEEYALPTHRH
jgi:hypothetical protein